MRVPLATSRGAGSEASALGARAGALSSLPPSPTAGRGPAALRLCMA